MLSHIPLFLVVIYAFVSFAGRGSATFIETVKSRHSKRLEALEKKLEEADKSRNPASNVCFIVYYAFCSIF